MRPIVLAAVLLAAAAPASAETVIRTGEVHVEKSVTAAGTEIYGYWHRVFGDVPGVRQFTFGGYTYLFYNTNTTPARNSRASSPRRGFPPPARPRPRHRQAARDPGASRRAGASLHVGSGCRRRAALERLP